MTQTTEIKENSSTKWGWLQGPPDHAPSLADAPISSVLSSCPHSQQFRPVHAQIGDPATLNSGGISLNINGTHRKRQRQLIERGPVVSGLSQGRSYVGLHFTVHWNSQDQRPPLYSSREFSVSTSASASFFISLASMGCICGRPSAEPPDDPRHEEAFKQIPFQAQTSKIHGHDVATISNGSGVTKFRNNRVGTWSVNLFVLLLMLVRPWWMLSKS
nr:hypothetical protein CFP56_70621 [Quercus suber]